MKVNFEIQKKTLFIGIAVFFALIVVIFGSYMLGKSSSSGTLNFAKSKGTENDNRLISVVKEVLNHDAFITGTSEYPIQEVLVAVDTFNDNEFDFEYLKKELTKQLKKDSNHEISLVNIENVSAVVIEEDEDDIAWDYYHSTLFNDTRADNFIVLYISSKNSTLHNESLFSYSDVTEYADVFHEEAESHYSDYVTYLVSSKFASGDARDMDRDYDIYSFYVIQDEKANSDGNYNTQDILTTRELLDRTIYKKD